MKTEPTICEMFADNGEHSHWELINTDTGETLWKEGRSSSKIKQLEWLDDNFPYRGCSVFADYIIPKKIGSYYTVILDIGTGIYINSFKTIEEAKASAQADFERRVMECLDYD